MNSEHRRSLTRFELFVAVAAAVFAVFIVGNLIAIRVLDGRVDSARVELDNARTDAGRLEEQVRDLGADPVVTPDEPQDPVTVEGPPGPAGATGRPGRDGVDGDDGKDGADGKPGKDGKPGEDGADGVDGIDGEDGTDGQDGADGVDGEDGADGQDGATGPAGYPEQFTFTTPGSLTSPPKTYTCTDTDGDRRYECS